MTRSLTLKRRREPPPESTCVSRALLKALHCQPPPPPDLYTPPQHYPASVSSSLSFLPKPLWLKQVCHGLSDKRFIEALGAMAVAADSATHSPDMLTCSYTNHALGTEHKVALLADPLLDNRVNFLALPPRGWTDWHGVWTWDQRTGQLSVNLHHLAGQLPLRQVATWRMSDRTFGWTQLRGYDHCLREITMRPGAAYMMYRGRQWWH